MCLSLTDFYINSSVCLNSIPVSYGISFAAINGPKDHVNEHEDFETWRTQQHHPVQTLLITLLIFAFCFSQEDTDKFSRCPATGLQHTNFNVNGHFRSLHVQLLRNHILPLPGLRRRRWYVVQRRRSHDLPRRLWGSDGSSA